MLDNRGKAMNGLPFTNAQGYQDVMSLDELYSVGKTHGHDAYGYGVLPVYQKPWHRFVYARFRDFDHATMCKLAGISDDCLNDFVKAEGLRSTFKPKYIHLRVWTHHELQVLLEVGPSEARYQLNRTYKACKARLSKYRQEEKNKPCNLPK